RTEPGRLEHGCQALHVAETTRPAASRIATADTHAAQLSLLWARIFDARYRFSSAAGRLRQSGSLRRFRCGDTRVACVGIATRGPHRHCRGVDLQYLGLD